VTGTSPARFGDFVLPVGATVAALAENCRASILEPKLGEREFSRGVRIADQIQREVANLILRKLDDPRVAGVTVSGVELSRDMAHATVFVTPAIGGAPEDAVAGLDHAARRLRGLLAKALRLRRMPDLRFVYDPTLDRAGRIDALLDERSREPDHGDSGR